MVSFSKKKGVQPVPTPMKGGAFAVAHAKRGGVRKQHESFHLAGKVLFWDLKICPPKKTTKNGGNFAGNLVVVQRRTSR